jgi:Glycosyl hydrolase family 26
MDPLSPTSAVDAPLLDPDGTLHTEVGPQPLLFGAYAPPAPESGLTAVLDLEKAIGRRVDIVLWYQHWAGWGPEFRPEWAESAATGGRIPLLTWEPWAPGSPEQPEFRLARIADGAFDAYVERWARDLAAYGRALYLRPMHEMNGNWYPWGGTVNGNSPRDYILAWHHLRRLFDRAGATNVRWVWSPQADDVPDDPANAFERYFPGSPSVDVLALDGYNWGTSVEGLGGWRSFDEIFASAYARLTRLGPQPVWIAETASDATGGDKPAWVRDMFASAAAYPRLRAIVWFHTLKERDWRATASSEVAAAFRQRP